MKICYIANVRLITTKAHSWQILKTCEALAGAGAEVELVAPRIPEGIDPFAHHKLKRNFIITYTNTPLLLNGGRFSFYLRSILFSLSAWLIVMRRPTETLIYSRDELSIFLASWTKKKTAWEMHTARFNWLISQAMRRSTFMVVISAGLKSFFIEHGLATDKCLVAPDGVDIEQFGKITNDKVALRTELSLPADKKIICYTGRYRTMGESKGVDVLFRWFPLVLANQPNFFLLIVGLSPEEKVMVEELVASLGLVPESYGLRGFVPREEVIKYLKSADVLAMNYPSTAHYDKFMSPLKLFEYLASGVPTVMPDMASLREIVNDDSAFFFQPDNGESFADAVGMALADHGKSGLALKIADKFSWSNRAKMIINFLLVK